MALKSDTLAQQGKAAVEKGAEERPYVNFEGTNDAKTSGVKCPSQSDEKEQAESPLANRTYERLSMTPNASRDDFRLRALAPADGGGVRFRNQNQQKQRVGMAVLDYEARTRDELTLKHGSMVEIVAEECGQKGWALARMDDVGGRGNGTRVGIVPRHYVALMGAQPKLVDEESVQRSDDFLGAGSYAEVFRGTYKGKEVALKLARDGNGEMLKKEALFLSRLHHENIVQFFGMSFNPLFIVLELCEGGTLLSLYRKMGSSDVLTVIFWAKQVASALEHLHGGNEPLVYADMKAENVLIKQMPCECGLTDNTWKTNNGQRNRHFCTECRGIRINRLTLKLADFNVSRYIGTKRDSCSGSMPWKSPEMMNQDAIANPKMDVWSFGMFIWELLSRTLPDMDAIFLWLNKRVGTPVPLPADLPNELRQIFDGCWRLKDVERPTIVQVQEQLIRAEQCMDSHYKWQLDTAKPYQQQSLTWETADGMTEINIPEFQKYFERIDKWTKKPSKMERMLASWFQPPEIKRHKRPMPKLDKQSIGTPIDFRHIVSAKVSERADNCGDKPMVIRYANAELPPLQRQPSHRSHDSLLECGGAKSGGNGALGYSTLPRTFKLQQQQTCPPPSSSNVSSHRLLPASLPQKSTCCRAHPCCAKKLGFARMKLAKSSPELNSLGIIKCGAKIFPMAVGDGHHPQVIRHRSPQPISRQHDYLSLLPPNCAAAAFLHVNLWQTHWPRPTPSVSPLPRDASARPKEQREKSDCPLRKDRAEPPDRAETDGPVWDDDDDIVKRQYVNVPNSVQKAARRTNAVRQRMVADATSISPEAFRDSSSGVTTPNDDPMEEQLPSSSSFCSAQLGGDVSMAREEGRTATGINSPTRHKDNRSRGIREEKQHHQQHNHPHHQQQHELPELFNRRVSPPRHPYSLSPSAASGTSVQVRRATCGELDKSKRTELGHSTFYVDDPESPEETYPPNSMAATSSSDEISGGRRRSTAGSGGVHRSIASLLFKPRIGAKSSPRCSDQAESDTVTESASGVTVAICFHPHHGTGITHLCALSSSLGPDYQLGMAPNQLSTRPIEFVNELSSSAGRVAAQRNVQHNPKFIKRADYPENQARQRHRTESAATAAVAVAQLPHRRTHLINAISGGGKCSTTTETGRQRRVSSSLMDTVIEMQHCAPPPGTAVDSTLKQWTDRSIDRPIGPSSPRGSSILDASIPFHAESPPFLNASVLLSPYHAAPPHWHQRSRSSESPAGKPLLSSNAFDAFLHRSPVPIEGSIANPSYVPMEESAKNGTLEERSKKPAPMPRADCAKRNEVTESSSARCPTSLAPVLNRAEMASERLSNAFDGLLSFSMPVSEQCRPTTLRLGPPPVAPSSASSPSVSLSTSTSNSFGPSSSVTMQNNGGGCDSGMCASSSNEGEDGFSPQTLTLPKNRACCSATVFPNVPYALLLSEYTYSSDVSVFPRHLSPPPPSCAHAFPHLDASPHFKSPPVPPKQQKECPRVPPLPRNRRMMKQ